LRSLPQYEARYFILAVTGRSVRIHIRILDLSSCDLRGNLPSRFGRKLDQSRWQNHNGSRTTHRRPGSPTIQLPNQQARIAISSTPPTCMYYSVFGMR